MRMPKTLVVVMLAAGALLGGMTILGPTGTTAQEKKPAPGAKPDTPFSQRFGQLANLPFVENRPTKETAQTLRDELLFQRAVQTYLWALPLVNTLGMKVGSEEKFGAGYNVLPVWKKRLDAKTLVTTPNSDVIYAMSYVDEELAAVHRDGTSASTARRSGTSTRRGCCRTSRK